MVAWLVLSRTEPQLTLCMRLGRRRWLEPCHFGQLGRLIRVLIPLLLFQKARITSHVHLLLWHFVYIILCHLKSGRYVLGKRQNRQLSLLICILIVIFRFPLSQQQTFARIVILVERRRRSVEHRRITLWLLIQRFQLRFVYLNLAYSFEKMDLQLGVLILKQFRSDRFSSFIF